MTPFLNNPTEPTEAFRILIVEDEAIVAESLKDQLVNLGYQVCGTAANGEDAMRIMEHSEPDLVMMDIMLEGPMDGVEVAGRIREKNEILVKASNIVLKLPISSASHSHKELTYTATEISKSCD